MILLSNRIFYLLEEWGPALCCCFSGCDLQLHCVTELGDWGEDATQAIFRGAVGPPLDAPQVQHKCKTHLQMKIQKETSRAKLLLCPKFPNQTILEEFHENSRVVVCLQDPGGLPSAQWDDSDPGVSPWGHTYHHQARAVQGGQKISTPSPLTGGDLLYLC